MNLELMERIMERGADLNIIALLYMCKQGEEIKTSNVKIQAYIRLMERKGFIFDGAISSKGEELIEYVEGGKPVVKEASKNKALEDIYDRTIERLVQLTGKKQIRTEIFSKTYNYFPTKYDFVSRLKGVMNKYKLNDVKRVEEVIIHNIEACNKSNKWFPLLMYYFTKDNNSQLAADYEAWEEIKIKKGEEYDGTNI